MVGVAGSCESLVDSPRASRRADQALRNTWSGSIRTFAYGLVPRGRTDLKAVDTIRTADFSHLAADPVPAHFRRAVKRAAFGFRRFAHYRIRALLYAGKPNWTLLAGFTPRWKPKRPIGSSEMSGHWVRDRRVGALRSR